MSTVNITNATKEVTDIREVIEEIVIPDGVVHISQGTFAYCTSLTKVTVPSSVNSIDYCTFWDCGALDSIYIDKEKDSLDLNNACIPEDCKVYWKGEWEV